MWGVDPIKICNRHLLGEHVEMHMFVGTIKNGISIDGYIKKGLVSPKLLKIRHDILAYEMIKRGMNHQSPIVDFFDNREGFITPLAEKELFSRCENCRSRIEYNRV